MRILLLTGFTLFVVTLLSSCRAKGPKPITVPMTLDHNRMLIDAEIQRKDGTWRPTRLWVDTGNPDFMMSEALARDLGIDLSVAQQTESPVREIGVEPPDIRLAGSFLDFTGVTSKVLFHANWLFGTMHVDANLPSTVMRRYQIIFDYPTGRLTIAAPGTLRPRGTRAAAAIDPRTGIIQIDAVVAAESLSFALDNGASFSFIPDELLARLSEQHPDWPRTEGAVGCANIWGWWPQEPQWPILRIPEIQWGPIRLTNVAVAGLPRMFAGGEDVGTWYSRKTARPVNGFLGPNAFKNLRVEIDFADQAIYFEGSGASDPHDLEIVGLTLRLRGDGNYEVIGTAAKDGKPSVDGVEPGDLLIQVGDLVATGATMGTVVDALRGSPGQMRHLVLEREGRRFEVDALVEHFL